MIKNQYSTIQTPIKWLTLILAGLALVYGAFSGVSLDGLERAGLLFRQFGDAGVFWINLGLAGLLILFGSWGLARWFRQLRRNFAMQPWAAGPPWRIVAAMAVIIVPFALVILGGIGLLLVRLTELPSFRP